MDKLKLDALLSKYAPTHSPKLTENIEDDLR